MKSISTLIIIILMSILNGQDIRTINLKSGERITGEIIATDTIKHTISIKTNYGILEINQDQINSEIVTIFLKSGDRLKGTVIAEDKLSIEIESKVGPLTLQKSIIENIDYNLIKSTAGVIEPPKKYKLGMDRQIDVFYDPTGYTLKKGVLYISGLSWGFGLSDKLQVTSSWAGYFSGNFNLRPKLRILRVGTLDNEHVLALGAHFHSRATVNKYEWIEDSFLFAKGHYDNVSNEWIETGDTTLYYGGYERIGTIIDVPESDRRIIDQYETDLFWYDTEAPDPIAYYEAFIAYTYSHARPGESGRISHTLGAIFGKHPDKSELMSRIYYGGAIDVRKNLIMNYELFYDPWYIEWWNRSEEIFNF
ncbi:MAG: hypothetical protein HQ528_09560, partial [Candidatus Marinimicrobia bacterium]|nr:hypothetical protein [Candidatus Neomarinimicrobiota bacterium]